MRGNTAVFAIIAGLVVSLLSVNAVAAVGVNGYEINGVGDGGSYLLVDGKIIVSGGELEITGVSKTPIDVIGDAKITLNNVEIEPVSGSAITIESGVKAEIVLEGDNVVAGVGTSAGINVRYESNTNKASLTISGDGTLKAKGGVDGGAGIGGNGTKNINALNGNISIESGTVKATAQKNSAGIGGGIGTTELSGSYTPGKITISGGKITATGAGGGAGIGGGYGMDAIVEVKGGDFSTVKGGNAESLGGAGIGSGYQGQAKVTISGGKFNTIVAGAGSPGIGDSVEKNETTTVKIGQDAQIEHIYTDGTQMPFGANTKVEGNMLQAVFSELEPGRGASLEVVNYDDPNESYKVEMPEGYKAFAMVVKSAGNYSVRGDKYFAQTDSEAGRGSGSVNDDIKLSVQTGTLATYSALRPVDTVPPKTESSSSLIAPETLDDAGIWGCLIIVMVALTSYAVSLGVLAKAELKQ